MKLEMGKAWTKRIERQIEGYEFEVGVLKDKVHPRPQRGSTKAFAGGPARKIDRAASGKATIGEILIYNQKRTNTDFLREPFQEKTSAIMKFTKEFLKLAFKHPGVNMKRVENLLQAIVRNPILKLDYGSNSSKAQKTKGFNRHLFDTAVMFNAIKAKVYKRV